MTPLQFLLGRGKKEIWREGERERGREGVREEKNTT